MPVRLPSGFTLFIKLMILFRNWVYFINYTLQIMYAQVYGNIRTLVNNSMNILYVLYETF